MKKYTPILMLFAALTFCSCSQPYTKITGFAEGTTYSITYSSRKSYKTEIENLLHQFENSLSVYNQESAISKVNRNEPVELDSFFTGCFELSKEVNLRTNGAFDISASPLFSAWGFGKEERTKQLSRHAIDSLMAFCGMDKIRIEGSSIVKKDSRVQLNCNAVAKGYSVDVVAGFLKRKGVASYLVEIGGEIAGRGVNKKGRCWSIGIDKPVDGSCIPGEQLQATMQLCNKGLATSGNYRRFFVENGQKFGHTINPKTGYPVTHSLLSATVIANDCGTADAFATALMVVGLDSAKHLLNSNRDLEGYLIYNDNNELKTYATAGFEKMLLP
ncbi:MAG: FAD:protein FMN transferase [Prevotellaceae bacterium]|jgi:thiamine biosynthesis lipoprotein|nr:FAD:protein FMN transferase [Prevotellaceae bacterium]